MLVAVPQSLANDGSFPSMQIIVVENWIEEVKQRVPLE